MRIRLQVLLLALCLVAFSQSKSATRPPTPEAILTRMTPANLLLATYETTTGTSINESPSPPSANPNGSVPDDLARGNAVETGSSNDGKKGEDTTVKTKKHWKPLFSADIGTGFVGVQIAESIEEPILRDTAIDSVLSYEADSTRVRLIRNRRTTWRPAFSSALIMWLPFTKSEVMDTDDEETKKGYIKSAPFGVGIGAHVVFWTDNNEARIAPAGTLHVGTPRYQIFFGFMFAPVDEVIYPNGQDNIIVSREVKSSDFVRKNSSKLKQFYMGIVIKGINIGKS